MSRFSGFGPGKRAGWTRRAYDLSTGETRDNAPPKPRTSSTRSGKGVRFQPFVSHQVTAEAAKRAGAGRVGRATHFTSESQLNAYLAHERAEGRDVCWKAHDHGE